MSENAAENSLAGTSADTNTDAIPVERPKRGRPRNDEVRARVKPLPKPPQMGQAPPLKFFKYWHTVDQQFPFRLKTFVYRRWPVCDRERLGLVKYLECLVVGDGLTSEDITPEAAESTLLHRYGSGDYKLIMNDGGAGNNGKHLMTCILTLRDADYPPIVDPMASLIMEDPSNRKFIEDCKRAGIKLPGDTQTEEQEEEDMAKVTTELTTTIGALVDRNTEMTKQVIEAATKREEKKDEKQSTQPQPAQSTDALQASLSIVSSAASMGTKIIESAVSKVGEIQAATASKEQDPVKTIEGFLKLASAMGNGGGNTAIIERLMENENQARAAERATMKEQNELLRSLIMGRLQNPILPPGSPGITGTGLEGIAGTGVAPVAAAPGQPRTIMDTIREFKEIQNLLGGGDSGGAEEDTGGGGGKSFWERNLPTVLQFGMIAANLIATSIHNLAVARSGQGRPVTPTSIPPAGQEAQDAPLPAPPPMMGQQPQVPTTDATLAQYHAFLATLKDPLLQSINNGETGYDFAEKLINWQGDMAYNFLRELGPERLTQALSTYPPIWEFVAKIPNRFTTFLGEFLEYGEPEDDPASPAAPNAAVPAAVKSARHRARNEAGGPSPVPGGVMAGDPLSPSPGTPQAVKTLPKVVVS